MTVTILSKNNQDECSISNTTRGAVTGIPPFSSTNNGSSCSSLELSKLESRVSHFCNSFETTKKEKKILLPFRNTSNNNSYNNSNSHSNNRIEKSVILQASAFLQSQHDELSRIEASLPSIVDLLLVDQYETVKASKAVTAVTTPVPAVKKMSLMDLSNHLRHLHSLHAKQILHIESTLVNQFGYVTASLRSQDDTPTDTDDIGGTGSADATSNGGSTGENGIASPGTTATNTSNTNTNTNTNTPARNNNMNSPLAAALNNSKPLIFEESQLFQMTPMNAPLPRLSEATLETDGGTITTPGTGTGTIITTPGGTSSSLLFSGSAGGKSTRSIANKILDGGSILKSLVEDMEEEKRVEWNNDHDHGGGQFQDQDQQSKEGQLEEYEESFMVDLQIDPAAHNDTSSSSGSTITSTITGNNEMPKTPSIKDIKLSIATMSFLEQSHSISSPSSSEYTNDGSRRESTSTINSRSSCSSNSSHSSVGVGRSLLMEEGGEGSDDSFNMRDIEEACESHCGDGDGDDDGVSCYDSCQEEVEVEKCMKDDEQHLDETVEEEDSSLENEGEEEDCTLSMTSTVVRDVNVNRLKKDLGLVDDDNDEDGDEDDVAEDEGTGKGRGANENMVHANANDQHKDGQKEDLNVKEGVPSVLLVQRSRSTGLEESREGLGMVFHNRNDCFMENNCNDLIGCSVTQIAERSQMDGSLHYSQLQNASNVDFDGGHGNGDAGSETESEDTDLNVKVDADFDEGNVDADADSNADTSNLLKDTRYSTIDTSLYRHPSVHEMNKTHVDTSIILESESAVTPHPHEQQVNANANAFVTVNPSTRSTNPGLLQEIVTSPLDRFQVQVLNGGSKCKVTPIGIDILKSTQSPILRVFSPILPSSVSSRERKNMNVHRSAESRSSRSPQIQHSAQMSFQSPLVQIRAKKVYPTTPVPERQEADIDTDSTFGCERDSRSTGSEDTESFYSSNTSQDEVSTTADSVDESYHLDNGMVAIMSIKETMHSIATECSASAFLPNVDNDTQERKAKDDTGVKPSEEGDCSKGDVPPPPIHDCQESSNTPNNAPTARNGMKTPASSTTPGGASTIRLSGILSRTPRAAAFIEKHMSHEKDYLYSVLNKGTPSASQIESSGRTSFVPKETNNLASDFASESPMQTNGLLEDDPRLIHPLTIEEYDAAPPIIKKLVSHDDLNRGIATINLWLISHEGEMPSSLPEKIAVEIFGETFSSSQVKRIFLSLCSLQRMMINRSKNSEMHYVILRQIE